MSEEQLKKLQEYNLEYLEAQASEEMFGGDFTSAVELKQAKREIERLSNQNKSLNEMYELTKKEYIRLNNIINELEKWCNESMYDDDQLYENVLDKLQELKGSNNNEQ